MYIKKYTKSDCSKYFICCHWFDCKQRLHILCKSKDAAGNISATSNAISVTTLNNTLVYCTSKGNSVADEYIDYVSIGGINTTAGNAGYGNFTNLWVIFLMVQTQSYLVLVLAVQLTLNIGKSD
jgi:hypothetical protein